MTALTVQTKVAILNMLAITDGGCGSADEALSWAVEQGYVHATGLDPDDAFFITPAGEEAIHEAAIHRGVGNPS